MLIATSGVELHLPVQLTSRSFLPSSPRTRNECGRHLVKHNLQEINMTKLINLGSVTGQTKFDPPDQTFPADSTLRCQQAINVVIDQSGTKATRFNVLCSTNAASEGICVDAVPPC
jgi:hypothetical protein